MCQADMSIGGFAAESIEVFGAIKEQELVSLIWLVDGLLRLCLFDTDRPLCDSSEWTKKSDSSLSSASERAGIAFHFGF